MTSPSAQIVTVTRAAPAQWDAAWRSSGQATYFHGRAWAEIHGDTHRPRPRLVTFDDGVTALLPLSRQRRARGLDDRTVSSPAGTAGGWIAGPSFGAAHASALVDWLTRSAGPIAWRVNPFDPEQVSAAPADGVTADATHALDLAAGYDGLEAAWKRRGGAVLRKARSAERRGVTVRTADGEDDWRAYFAVYEDSLARWGDRASSRYDWPLFDRIRARASGHETLWLAEVDGRVVAGALCFASRCITSYWHGATLASFFDRRPVNLLMLAAIRDACARGATWFDFGPSGAHAGVARFKASFGATLLPCPLFKRERFTHHLLAALPRAA
ncbi:MAG: GNAT family N-acetyltransferase [Planctomycetota bacterium]|jgi:CelD/BcsL family acetyltransferase involved in cellulose biosynthesis